MFHHSSRDLPIRKAHSLSACWLAAGILVLVLALGCGVAGLIQAPSVTPTDSSQASSGSPAFGKRTKTSGCMIQDKFPDPACTPGAVFPNATKEQVCASGYSSGVRDVSDKDKNTIYAEYGITKHTTGQYEVDHFVSLELGGSNDLANLWPEAADPKPGFHEKDKVENYLHDQVCSGPLTLGQAQIQIATNWLAIYQKLPGN